jgi:hypothetical protein
MKQIRHEDSLQEKERRFLNRLTQAEIKLKARGLRFARVEGPPPSRLRPSRN